jgi:repressor LexA
MLKLFGFRSKNAVARKIDRLVASGLVAKDRTGRLIPPSAARPVRLLGAVQAGFPSPAEEETVDLISLDEYLVSNPQATFLLKVDGDSMAEAGIMPGDLVLIQKGLPPRDGDIVVASVDNEWTLKRFARERGRVVLRAANRKYPPITARGELVIAGVVIANVRKYK